MSEERTLLSPPMERGETKKESSWRRMLTSIIAIGGVCFICWLAVGSGVLNVDDILKAGIWGVLVLGGGYVGLQSVEKIMGKKNGKSGNE